VTTFVVDASVVIKWVVEEEGTAEALTLRSHSHLLAPELLVAECANILWKKVQRGELLRDEALFASRVLERADVEILPTRALLSAAVRIAIELGHPAYDCLYLALALDNDCRFATADQGFLRRLAQGPEPLRGKALSLAEAAALCP
jgi:predicted nucleic acid-binding protein